MAGRARTLVALLGETRASELTAEAFCSNVLDELDADLALPIRAGEPRNLFHEKATYLWEFEEPGDWSAVYDREAGGPDWRALLDLGPIVLGGIDEPGHSQSGSAAILTFYRQLLWTSLQREGLLDEYDWF